MAWAPFHHPDFSLPVLRRQLADELLDLVYEFSSGHVFNIKALFYARLTLPT